MEAWRLADLHAYVDDCLEPDERLAFETRWRRIPRWRAAPHSGERKTAPFARPSTARAQKPFRSASFATRTRPGRGRRRPRSAADRRSAGAIVIDRDCGRPRSSAEAGSPTRFGRRSYGAWASRRCPSVLPAFGLRPRSSSPPNNSERPALRLSGIRPSGVEPVEFATSDRTEAEAWLTTRLRTPSTSPRPLRRQADRSADRSLPRRAGRVSALQVPRRPLGLLIQSLDAPQATAPRLLGADGGTRRYGHARPRICPGRRPGRKRHC